MAKKKITDLQLIGAITDDLNIPSDNGIMTYRATALQMKNYILAPGNIGTAQIADEAVNLAKLSPEVLAFLDLIIPVGTILPFGGSTAPDGFLLITSSSADVSRSDYARLFSVLGTAHGSGDGSTTFGLPKLQGIDLRFVGSQTFGGKTYTSTLGQRRNDNMAAHFHEQEYNGSAASTIEVKFGVVTSAGGSASRRQAFSETSNSTSNAPRTGSVGSGTENHSAHYALHAILKY